MCATRWSQRINDGYGLITKEIGARGIKGKGDGGGLGEATARAFQADALLNQRAWSAASATAVEDRKGVSEKTFALRVFQIAQRVPMKEKKRSLSFPEAVRLIIQSRSQSRKLGAGSLILKLALCQTSRVTVHWRNRWSKLFAEHAHKGQIGERWCKRVESPSFTGRIPRAHFHKNTLIRSGRSKCQIVFQI